MRLSEKDITTILIGHLHWLKEDCENWDSMRANLSGESLVNVTLNDVVLSKAVLHAINFSGACLRSTDFSFASLTGTNFCFADLRGANFSGADLRGVNFSSAILHEANFKDANILGANFNFADTTNIKNMPYYPMACPEKEGFRGYKKAIGISSENPVIVELYIPPDALRSSAGGRKCRCNKAIVLSITDIYKKLYYGEARSKYNYNFIYRVGETVEPIKDFDLNRWNECSSGIHFFLNRQEAVNYNWI